MTYALCIGGVQDGVIVRYEGDCYRTPRYVANEYPACFEYETYSPATFAWYGLHFALLLSDSRRARLDRDSPFTGAHNKEVRDRIAALPEADYRKIAGGKPKPEWMKDRRKSPAEKFYTTASSKQQEMTYDSIKQAMDEAAKKLKMAYYFQGIPIRYSHHVPEDKSYFLSRDGLRCVTCDPDEAIKNMDFEPQSPLFAGIAPNKVVYDEASPLWWQFIKRIRSWHARVQQRIDAEPPMTMEEFIRG